MNTFLSYLKSREGNIIKIDILDLGDTIFLEIDISKDFNDEFKEEENNDYDILFPTSLLHYYELLKVNDDCIVIRSSTKRKLVINSTFITKIFI